MKWKRGEAAELIGSVGVALLIAGFVRYSIQGELLPASKIMLIAGAVLLPLRSPSASAASRHFSPDAPRNWAPIP
jgi:hypothetical protein